MDNRYHALHKTKVRVPQVEYYKYFPCKWFFYYQQLSCCCSSYCSYALNEKQKRALVSRIGGCSYKTKIITYSFVESENFSRLIFNSRFNCVLSRHFCLKQTWTNVTTHCGKHSGNHADINCFYTHSSLEGGTVKLSFVTSARSFSSFASAGQAWAFNPAFARTGGVFT